MSPPEHATPLDFGDLYEGAPCGLLLTERGGTIRWANQTFCRWIGVERDALVGQRRFQDLLTMGGRIFHQTHWAPLLQMQGSVAEVKLDVVHAEGHAMPMVMNAISRTRESRVMHELALFMAKDRHTYERELMRARQQAEQLLARQMEAQQALTLTQARLRMALETAQLHIWGMDPVTGERHYEPGVALLLGKGMPQPVNAAQYMAAIDPSDHERVMRTFGRLLDGSTDVYRCTYRVNGADGVQRMVLATARAFQEDPGQGRRIIGALQDVTELSRQRAAAEDRALFAEQMIGIVSHDLRNPLAAIMLGTDALERAELGPRHARILSHIGQSARRAQRLIADLLDFTVARIGRGLTLNVKPVDMHALVADYVEELALAHPGRTLRHQSHGHGLCTADPDRLFQLISNLVSNAMAYGDAASPVTVSSRIEGDEFTLAVHNHGPSIPPSLLLTLFQPMVRGTDTPSEVRSVGLGLYIVNEIARAHGGRVGVTSSDRDGTTFMASFPALATAPA